MIKFNVPTEARPNHSGRIVHDLINSSTTSISSSDPQTRVANSEASHKLRNSWNTPPAGLDLPRIVRVNYQTSENAATAISRAKYLEQINESTRKQFGPDDVIKLFSGLGASEDSESIEKLINLVPGVAWRRLGIRDLSILLDKPVFSVKVAGSPLKLVGIAQRRAFVSRYLSAKISGSKSAQDMVRLMRFARTYPHTTRGASRFRFSADANFAYTIPPAYGTYYVKVPEDVNIEDIIDGHYLRRAGRFDAVYHEPDLEVIIAESVSWGQYSEEDFANILNEVSSESAKEIMINSRSV